MPRRRRFGLVVVGWALVADNPLGGEPMVVVSTPNQAGADDGGRQAGDGQNDFGPIMRATPVKPMPPPGGKTVTISMAPAASTRTW